jgi:Phosphotransferase enzyme family
MSAALGSIHPEIEVTDVALLMRDDGTNRRARLTLTYSGRAGPEVVFLKAEGEHRLLHFRNGNLFNESALFASGVPLYVDHPVVYHVEIDREALDWLIVMEDVTRRGGDPRDSTRPMTVDQVANGTRSLARLHGAYWDFSVARPPELEWVQMWAPTEGFSSGLRSRIPLGLERGAAVLPSFVRGLDADEIVDIWARYVTSLTQGPVTLLHGDAHIGNTYVLPDDTVGFLDWQVVRSGNWSQDTGYFAVGALTLEDRRTCEHDLVEEHRKALDLAEDRRPGRDEAWLRYRASAAYGLPIWLSTLGTDGFQTHEVSAALVERYAAAFMELDSLAALRQLGV